MPLLQSFSPAAGRRPASVPSPISGAAAAVGTYRVLPMPPLEWNEQVARETAHLYERVKKVILPISSAIPCSSRVKRPRWTPT